MGIDDFKTDDTQTQTSSDEKQEDEQQEEENEEEKPDNEVSGIEAFRTGETDPTQEQDSHYDNEDEFIFGLKPWRWNEMSQAERIRHVRANYIEDYYPHKQPDGRWSYERMVEVECVCGEVFTFQTEGMCFSCGRVYKDAGRTVIKVNEIDKNDNHE